MDIDKKYGRFLMSCVNEEAFVDKNSAVANLGDNIQSLVMDYIFKVNDIPENKMVYVKRDFANECTYKQIDLILHSEFSTENLSSRIMFNNNYRIILLLSILLYDDIDVLLKKNNNIIKFFKAHEPIGCRDEKTTKELRKYGIEAYLMGCFTICLPRRNPDIVYKKIFFVDTPKELEEYVPEYIKNDIEYLSHSVAINKVPVDISENKRLDDLATNLLKRYRDEAKLVVTSRLHVAAPCLAMGVPVIVTNNNLDFRFGWIDKFIKLYQLGEYQNIDWNPKPIYIEHVKDILMKMFMKVFNNESYRNELLALHDFYIQRNRTDLYRNFKHKLKYINTNNNKIINYAIWGKGMHCRYVYDLMKEMYPEINLVCIIDKFKSGYFKSIKIVRESELSMYDIDLLLITTVPGTNDALKWLSNHPNINYEILTSQNKS